MNNKLMLGAVLISSLGFANVPWSVNLHPESPDACYDTIKANDAFNYIIDLGAKYVRTDICWYDLEPANNSWDTMMINWYGDYINAANVKGLEVIVVLYRPPNWAMEMYNYNPTQFWMEWQEYCTKVAEFYGTKVYYYQMWNEANHPFDGIEPADDWQLFYYAHNGLGTYDDSLKTMVNVFCNTTGWEDALLNWLSNADNAIDIIGIDHYPGTWTITNYTDWLPLDRLIYHISTLGDPCYGKEGAVMETGFATYTWPWHTREDQKNFINQALPVIREKIFNYNPYHPNKILFCNWYELIDANSLGAGYPEYHFGVLTTDREEKIGYPDLKYQISQFNNVSSYSVYRPFVAGLLECAPNPFHSKTTIKFESALGGRNPKSFTPLDSKHLTGQANSNSQITIKIYNSAGQLIRQWDNKSALGGIRLADKIVWDGKDESGKPVKLGAYFCQLLTGDFTINKKIIVIR